MSSFTYPVGPVRTVISPLRNPLMREVKPGRLGMAAIDRIEHEICTEQKETTQSKIPSTYLPDTSPG